MPAFPAGVHLKGGRNAAPVLAELAREFYAPIIPIVTELRSQGLSLRAIAAELTRRGVKSRHGWPRWSAAQVRRVLLRAEEPSTKDGKAGCKPVKHPLIAPLSAPAPEKVPAATVLGIYLRLGGEARGPFPVAELRAKLAAPHVGAAPLARRDPAEPWRPLRDVLDQPG